MTISDYDEILQLLSGRIKGISNIGLAITPEMNLINQLAIDSIKLLDLIMEIEDTFDISVPMNALTDVQTVADLASLIHSIKSTSQ